MKRPPSPGTLQSIEAYAAGPSRLRKKSGLRPSGTRYTAYLGQQGTSICAKDDDAGFFPQPASPQTQSFRAATEPTKSRQATARNSSR
jgi:hypothetical protein